MKRYISIVLSSPILWLSLGFGTVAVVGFAAFHNSNNSSGSKDLSPVSNDTSQSLEETGDDKSEDRSRNKKKNKSKDKNSSDNTYIFESDSSNTSSEAQESTKSGSSGGGSSGIVRSACLDRAGADILKTTAANGFTNDPDWATEYIYKNNNIPTNRVFDATNSSFIYGLINSMDAPQLYSIALRGGTDICWSGGRVVGTNSHDDHTDWEVWHDLNGFRVGGIQGFTFEDIYLRNYGDLINISDDDDELSDGFKIRDSLLRHSHDDCVQNDKLASGKIIDSFLDGCYTAISARMTNADSSAGIIDGSSKTYEIKDTLIWLEPMSPVFSGPVPGHGGFFKWENTNPSRRIKLSLKNVTLMATMDPAGKIGNEAGSSLVSCENVTVVWLGSGAYPGYDWPAGCVTVKTGNSGKNYWLNKVDKWYDDHPWFKDLKQPDSYYF